MTTPPPAQPPPEPVVDRVLSAILRVALWAVFACLAAGLLLWVASPGEAMPIRLLNSGLIGLLALPLLKLLAVVASSALVRDWITLAATLAVLAILVALTLRDAASY